MGELYSLLSRWKEQIPSLPWEPISELDDWLKNPRTLPDQYLTDESGEELVTRIQNSIRATIQSWDSPLKKVKTDQKAVFSRVLRMTEEEAVRYTATQWQRPKKGQFETVGPVFAAYRETPFQFLYRGSTLVIRRTRNEVVFTTDHPLLEVESAWMRGFIQYLRPSIRVEFQTFVGEKNAFHWQDRD